MIDNPGALIVTTVVCVIALAVLTGVFFFLCKVVSA